MSGTAGRSGQFIVPVKESDNCAAVGAFDAGNQQGRTSIATKGRYLQTYFAGLFLRAVLVHKPTCFIVKGPAYSLRIGSISVTRGGQLPLAQQPAYPMS